MIIFDVTNIKEDGEKYLDKLTCGKKEEIRNEMIKCLKEWYWAESLEYGICMEFINNFFMKNPMSFLKDEFGNEG